MSDETPSPVRYDATSCRAAFESMVGELVGRYPKADLPYGLGVLLRCTGPLPDGLDKPARRLVEFALEERRDSVYFKIPYEGTPYAALGMARLAGPDLYERVAGMLAADSGPIGRDELALLSGWDVIGHALVVEMSIERRKYSSMGGLDPLPDACRRLAEHGYAEFACKALEVADARVAAIQSGEIPYTADQAFTSDEVAVLGRAARVALMRDEPWLPELFDRLLRGVAVAPTAAKTLPSQALLYELTRAAEDFPIPEMVTILREARTVTRHAGVPKQLDRMLKRIDVALAERADVALRFPDLGFEPGGVLRRPLGEHEAVIVVDKDVELQWRRSDGMPLRGVPAAVRRGYGTTVKELRELVKRVRVQLTTLAKALESGFTVEATQPFAQWQAQLAAHPIAATMVRRLIWEIETAPGSWQTVLPAEGGAVLQDAERRILEEVDENAPVRLWHPIRATTEEIRAWRDLLTAREIRQPFKQAFREIYLLTPAEEETGVYSNRFAAHIVRYRRLFALFRTRGWQSNLLGRWDGGHEDRAERTLVGGEWQARFLHRWADDWIGTEELAVTDQVRFARRRDGDWREVPLAEVPPVVFSEAMRDVDLFVAVTSIATDPDWIDRGEDAYGAYWRSAGFGDLSGSAEVRRDALARILPRTKIAGRCAIDGRFLVVRGDLRTYKIHLGSGNILMEPDDVYLCIVQGRARSDGKVFLPFEDERLAVILSKAFLLAVDTKITDPTILNQIERGA